MVSSATVGALVRHLLFGLVTSQALLGVVTSAAYPAHPGTGAVGLVMAEALASVAAEGFGRVGAKGEQPPVSQVEVCREWAPHRYNYLPSLFLEAWGDASRCFFHLREPQKEGEGHPAWISHQNPLGGLNLRIQLH